MIFVTVGTDHHQFPRLLKAVDQIAAQGDLQEDFVVQYGMNKFVPTHCESHDFLSFDEMREYIDKSRIVITHGSSTALLVLAANKSPVIVPRLKKLNEIVDDHQYQFAQSVKEIAPVLVVNNIADLESTLQHYDRLAQERRQKFNGAAAPAGGSAGSAVATLHDVIRGWFPDK